ncbi:MAG: hypothetical protein DHS20C13_20150 [Thermodesulfobacteriota bacterium]|nr:MAG: hypothetical protein DHS20C13_20150 [Thermodesulfobacteriota bacterium]
MDNKYIYSLTVLSIVLIFSSLSYSQDVENKACNVIQITQGEEDSRDPFVCGDGTGILFLSRADLLNNGHPDQIDIFFADIIDPFNPIFYQLTNTPESESRISISDDCTKIAFGSESDLTGGNPLNEDQLFYGDINNPNNPIYTQLTNVVDENFFQEYPVMEQRLALVRVQT